MEGEEIKTLKEKLLEAVNKVLIDNKANLTNKIEKVVKKSIKRIVKKTNKQIKKTPKKINYESRNRNKRY
jgi:ElaB/YqjD/DUF883 family membrane-anchored ribosome-binding protein